jgi:hypothetical protein
MVTRPIPVCVPAPTNGQGAPIPTTAAVTELPPWIFPPVNSIAFDNAGDILLPAIGVGETVVFQFTVPTGHNGVIKEIANAFIGSGFTDGSGQIIWRILQNNQAVRGKENILNSLGSVAIPSRVGGGAYIRIIENDIIALTVNNVAIAPAGQLIAGRLSGWFYKKDIDPTEIWF